MLLPRIRSENDYRQVYRQTEAWLPAIRAICERHGLSRLDLRRQVLGTHIVFRTGDLIVKLFCWCWPNDFVAEKACLEGLDGLPIPGLVEIGEFESWPYMILTVVDGNPVVDVWPSLDLGERTGIMHQLGQFMRDLHRQPLVSGLPKDWDSYLAERIAELDEHHQLEEPWREWAHRKVADVVQHRRESVTLNCDLTDDHVLIRKKRGRWQLSGVIDFGDSMIGPGLFEFSVPLLCFCSGEQSSAKVLVESYGLKLTPDLAEDILAYCLVHEYISLTEITKNMKATAPESLAEAMWGCIAYR